MNQIEHCFSLFAFEVSYHKTETRNAVNIVRIKERQSLLQNGLKSSVPASEL